MTIEAIQRWIDEEKGKENEEKRILIITLLLIIVIVKKNLHHSDQRIGYTQQWLGSEYFPPMQSLWCFSIIYISSAHSIIK